jgi:hypothetical protein
MFAKRISYACASAATVFLATAQISMTVYATAPGVPATYTLDADFDQGTLVNVNHTAVQDQLQLNGAGEPFNFIWVAASGRGTIVKINTLTGQILGEYWSAPNDLGRNPSRTTVDADGNVWSGNRDESGPITGYYWAGSVVKIGLLENNQCVERNGTPGIQTSSGLGDIKPWSNTGGADNDGGVSTAEDECILLYQRVPDAPNIRHVSVDANNDVWVGGYPYYPTSFAKLAGATGAILATFWPDCGGYGGLIDGNNVLWSAGLSQFNLLRWDLTAGTGSCIVGYQSYGLGIDNEGDIWNAQWIWNTVVAFTPAGGVIGGYPSGGSGSRGVVVTPADNNVWIANSYSDTVTRLGQSGSLLAAITVGDTPTGVAVDGAGKVWVTNYGSSDVMRINPLTNLVDLTVSLGEGAYPYNYSDMTGSTLTAPPSSGTWTVVHETLDDPAKLKISWNASVPSDSSLGIKIACSSDGTNFDPEFSVNDGDSNDVTDCQYVKVIASFTRASTGESPILYDLTIESNEPPDCSAATASPAVLWSPNHLYVPISILGVTDPDEDTLMITITSIRQDEAVNAKGSGNTCPDGKGVGSSTAAVRAERVGGGNGRVYHIGFNADDGNGGTCSGTVGVLVPHDQGNGATAVDNGPNFDSTRCP